MQQASLGTCPLPLALVRAAAGPRRWIDDPDRFPAQSSGKLRRGLRRFRERVLGHLGLCPGARAAAARLEVRLRDLSWDWDAVASAYALFGDQQSRDCFVRCLTARLLGSEYADLLDTSRYESARQATNRWQGASTGSRGGLATFEFGIPTATAHVKMVASPLHARNTFALEQYRYSHGDVTIEASAGDWVLDGGACWGDSALYFAAKAGPSGHVLAVEADPENLEHLQANVEANPSLKPQIEWQRGALWSEAGLGVNLTGDGPGGRIQTCGDKPVTTTTIDELANGPLANLSLIKLDIEGAELEALEGAHRTLRERAPKLAIACYHRHDDLWRLPLKIHQLQPRYQFYLDHFTPYLEETVLFARSVDAA